MSVRLIKIIISIIITYGVLFSVVLIGFPIPRPRPSADFVYVGTGLEDGEGDALAFQQNPSSYKRIEFDHFDAVTFKPWMKLRDLNKPKR